MSVAQHPRASHSSRVLVILVAVLSVTAAASALAAASRGGGPSPLASTGSLSAPGATLAPAASPAAGSLSMNPTLFANGGVPTSAVFNGGTFGAGASVSFCISPSPTFSSSTPIGSYVLAAGATSLVNAVVGVRASQVAGAYYVAATDGSCGGGSSTYTSPVSATLVATPYPSFSLTNATVTVGATVDVSGSGWDSGATVTVYLGYLGSSPSLASFTTTAVGGLPASATFTVPSGLPQGTYGVFAQETHGPATGGGVWVGFSSPYAALTNFFSVGPSISVSPSVFNGASGSALTITGQGFRASSTISANSITVGGVGTTHGAVSVSPSGTFSVSVTTLNTIGSPGGAQTVRITTSPSSSTTAFADAAWVSSPNPGALSLLVNGVASGPVVVTPTASLQAEAWNFPAGATVLFEIGPNLVGSVAADSLGFAALPATATVPAMPAGSYRATASDPSAGLYANPVSMTVNRLSTVYDVGGFVLPTSGTTEFLPSGGGMTAVLYGLVPGSSYTIADTVFAPLVSASILASDSIGLANLSGFATVAAGVGTFSSTTGGFTPAANGTVIVSYSPLYALYPLYGVSVPSTGTTETISLCPACASVGTYEAIGTPSIQPADWTAYLAGATTSVLISNLIPSGSLLYSGSPAVSYYYNVYVGPSLLHGTAASTYCLASSPSTCYTPSGTLSITFAVPAATGIQELSIVYSGGSPVTASLAQTPVVVSTAGASVGSGTIVAVTDPVSGDTMVVGYDLFPGASTYRLNVSTATGVQQLTPSVLSSGAMTAVDLSSHGYLDEPAGVYSVVLYLVGSGGTHASLSTTYSVGLLVSVSPTEGVAGTAATLTASGLASGAYYDLLFGANYLMTAQATLSGDLSAAFSVPSVGAGAYVVGLDPTGSGHAVASTSFTVTSDIAWSPDPSAFPDQRVSFTYTLPAALSKTPLAGTQGYAAVLLNGTPYAVVPASYSGATLGSTVSGSFTMFNGAPGSYYTLSVVPEYSVAATTPTSVAFPFTAAATPVAESFVFSAPSGLSVVSATASLTDTTTGTASATAVTVTVTATTVTFTVAATSQVASDAYVVTATVLLTSGASTTYVDTARTSSPTTLTLVSGSGAFVVSLNQSDIAEIVTQTGRAVNISIDQLSAKVSDVYTRLNATYVALTTNFGNMTVALDTISATLAGIGHNVLELNTTLGTFGLTLDQVNASLTTVANGVAELTTAVGDLNLSVAQLNATLGRVDGNVATVLTDLGSVQASLAALNTTVTATSVSVAQIQRNVNSLLGQIVSINTTLGTLSGTVSQISGQLATISTSIGNLQVSVNQIQGTVNSINTSTGTTVTNYLIIVLILAAVAVALAAVVVGLLLSRARRGPPPPRGWSAAPPQGPPPPHE